MTAETFTVYLADGRRLEVLAAGPADGLPLVLHNGTPVGPVAYTPMADAAAERGLRMVICARPGYGDSTPRPGRRVADVTDDVIAVLDELGAPRFVTVGWSGGGPHALACAARLPGRCLAAATMAGGRAVHRRGTGLARRDGRGERDGVRRRGRRGGPAHRLPGRGSG